MPTLRPVPYHIVILYRKFASLGTIRVAPGRVAVCCCLSYSCASCVEANHNGD